MRRALLALAVLVTAGCASPVPDAPAVEDDPVPSPSDGPVLMRFECPSGGDPGPEPCLDRLLDIEGHVVTSLAVHPGRPEVLVLGVDGPRPDPASDPGQPQANRVSLFLTEDAGLTWALLEVPATPASGPAGNLYGFAGELQLAFTPDGTLHAVANGATSVFPPLPTGPLYRRIGVHLSSPDLGRTWSEPRVLLPDGANAYHRLQVLEPGILAVHVSDDNGPDLAWSADAGATWTIQALDGTCTRPSPWVRDGAQWAAVCTDSGDARILWFDPGNASVRFNDGFIPEEGEGDPPETGLPESCLDSLLVRRATDWLLVSGGCPDLELRTAASTDGNWTLAPGWTGDPFDAWTYSSSAHSMVVDGGGVGHLLSTLQRLEPVPNCTCPGSLTVVVSFDLATLELGSVGTVSLESYVPTESTDVWPPAVNTISLDALALAGERAWLVEAHAGTHWLGALVP